MKSKYIKYKFQNPCHDFGVAISSQSLKTEF